MSSNLDFGLLKNGVWLKIPIKRAICLTLRQICTSPMVIKFLLEDGPCYFTADHSVWLKLKAEGKEVRSIGKLFEAYRKTLVSLGFSNDSIYDWSLDRLICLQTALKVFPGAQVVSCQMEAH